MANFDGTDDYFDSREAIERIDELIEEWEEATECDFHDFSTLSTDDLAVGLGEDGAAELEALLKLRGEAEGNIADWQYGETFISDDDFVDYAKELVIDCGLVSAELPSWIVIDWEETAQNVRADYTSFEFRGTTYWAR